MKTNPGRAGLLKLTLYQIAPHKAYYGVDINQGLSGLGSGVLYLDVPGS